MGGAQELPLRAQVHRSYETLTDLHQRLAHDAKHAVADNGDEAFWAQRFHAEGIFKATVRSSASSRAS